MCIRDSSHPIHQSHKNGTRFWMASQPTPKSQHPFSEVFTWFSPALLTVTLHFLHNFPSFSAMRPACSRAPCPLLPLSFLHDSRLFLAFCEFPSLKMQNARRQLPARRTKGCSRVLVVVFWTGGHRLVASLLDHRRVGRPMMAHDPTAEENPLDPVGPPAGDTSQGKEGPTHRKFRHSWGRNGPPLPQGLTAPAK